MNALHKIFALFVTLVGLTGVAWAVDPADPSTSGDFSTTDEYVPGTFYESHFNVEELENQF